MPGLEIERQSAGHRQDVPRLIGLLKFQIQNPGRDVNLLIMTYVHH